MTVLDIHLILIMIGSLFGVVYTFYMFNKYSGVEK